MLAYQPQCGPIITYAQPCPGFHMYRSSIQDEGLATLQARCKALQAKAEEMEIYANTVTMPRSGHTYIIVRMRHWSRRRSSATLAILWDRALQNTCITIIISTTSVPAVSSL